MIWTQDLIIDWPRQSAEWKRGMTSLAVNAFKLESRIW